MSARPAPSAPKRNRRVTEEVIRGFDIVHTSDAWILPLEEGLRGVTAAEAAWKPGVKTASIAEIVAHVTSWTAHNLALLEGRKTPVRDWPAVGEMTEETWKGALAALDGAIEAFRAGIGSLTAEELFSQPEGSRTMRFRRVMNIIVHNAYHAGQIAKLRALRRASLPLA